MRYGIIQIPVTDLHKRSEFHSERLTQALFGTPVKMFGKKKEYVRITLPEGYAGWVRQKHIMPVSKKRWEKSLKLPNAIVKSDYAIIRNDKTLTKPFRLFFGTKLIVKNDGGKYLFEHPSGVYIPVPQRDISVHYPRQEKVTGKEIVKTALRFLGVPYLWGGITPCGFDCSGLVYSIYRFYGIDLPRDSSKQSRIGLKITREMLKPGDLLFFKGHVAISLGGEGIIHASSTSGMVAKESLSVDSEFYREDLDEGFLFGRRVI